MSGLPANVRSREIYLLFRAYEVKSLLHIANITVIPQGSLPNKLSLVVEESYLFAEFNSPFCHEEF